jgi:hypothetical protein
MSCNIREGKVFVLAFADFVEQMKGFPKKKTVFNSNYFAL